MLKHNDKLLTSYPICYVCAFQTTHSKVGWSNVLYTESTQSTTLFLAKVYA